MHKIMEIAVLMTGVPAMNEGGQSLVRLWNEEHGLDNGPRKTD